MLVFEQEKGRMKERGRKEKDKEDERERVCKGGWEGGGVKWRGAASQRKDGDRLVCE